MIYMFAIFDCLFHSGLVQNIAGYQLHIQAFQAVRDADVLGVSTIADGATLMP